MKTIGMIGGTGWLSTLEYYRIINQETNKRLGGFKFSKDHAFIIQLRRN